MSATTLHAFLAAYEALATDPAPEIADVIRRLADAAIGIRDTIGSGALERALPEARESTNADGDVQKAPGRPRRPGLPRCDAAGAGRLVRLRGAGRRRCCLNPDARAGPRHRPSGRLVEHRARPLDRNDLLAPPCGRRRRRRSGRHLPAAGAPAAGCRIFHLRAAARPGADAGQRNARLPVLGDGRRLRAAPRALRHPAPRPGIRHQRLELPPLGRCGAQLRRRLPEGRRGPARARLQHALDRVAGRRGLPHPGARRRLPLSRRRAGPAIPTAGCGWSTRRTRSPS